MVFFWYFYCRGEWKWSCNRKRKKWRSKDYCGIKSRYYKERRSDLKGSLKTGKCKYSNRNWRCCTGKQKVETKSFHYMERRLVYMGWRSRQTPWRNKDRSNGSRQIFWIYLYRNSDWNLCTEASKLWKLWNLSGWWKSRYLFLWYRNWNRRRSGTVV